MTNTTVFDFYPVDVAGLTWADFDRAVDVLAAQLSRHSLTGVYGIPHGGRWLVEAFSHRLDVPLLLDPIPGCAIVDDFVDTGSTLSRNWSPDCALAVWITSDIPNRRWIHTTMLDRGSHPAFPWDYD
jgi:hypothetical protein